MTYLELKELVKNVKQASSPSDFAGQYLAWNAITRADLASLSFVGKMEATESVEPGSNVDESEFWSRSGKIIPNAYPYSECDVYCKENGNEYFLIYEEFGGHRPELRCRYFDTGLIE